MKRFKVYYIGLILAIVSMNWLTHFAVEPSRNFNNVYTQRALLETLSYHIACSSFYGFMQAIHRCHQRKPSSSTRRLEVLYR